MFAKKLVTQSMIDAVNSVLEQSDSEVSQQHLLGESIDHKGLAMQGKMHPVWHDHMDVDKHSDFYDKSGKSCTGTCVHKNNKEVHMRQHGTGLIHKFKVAANLEEEKKRMLLEPELDETGFHKAAHAAKKAGESHFEFQGKKYPVTAKSHAEAIKIATPTGTKVLGSRYGNSAKAHRDAMADTMAGTKGPKEKELKDIEKEKPLKETDDCVTKPEAKKIAKKEVSHHNVTMHKGKKNTVKMENYFANKLLNSLNEAKSTGTEEIFTDNNMGESEMTDAQKKKREKIVMSMKKGEAGMKQRYGKNWKNVMYATATKQAMKEDSSDTWEGEELDEAAPKKNQDVADKSYLKTAGKKPGPLHNVGKGMVAFLKGKKEPMESVEYDLEEGNKSHTHAAHYENEKGEWTGMNLLTAKDDEDAISQAHEKCKDGCRLSRVERHIPVKEEYELDETTARDVKMAIGVLNDKRYKGGNLSGATNAIEKMRKGLSNHPAVVKAMKKANEEYVAEAEEVKPRGSKSTHATDMLRGRVQGIAKFNSFKSYKTELETGGGMNPPSEADEGEDTKEKQKITTNPGPVDVKFDDKLGNPIPQHYFASEKNITTEQVRSELKNIRSKETSMRNKEVSNFEKHPATKDLLAKEETNNPTNTARERAMKSFKKLKKETMMGKISN
jgi:hypothetical protein